MCPCGLIYVRSSTCPVKTSILDHFSRIKNKIMDALLISHFLEKLHTYDQIKFCVIFQYRPQMYNRSDPRKTLLQKY